MSGDRDDALLQEMRELLRAGRPGVDPPDEARQAVLAFVGAAATGGGGPHGGGGGGAAAAPGARVASTILGAKTAFGVGGLIVGAVLGAGGHAAFVAQRAAPVVSVTASPPAEVPSTVTTAAPLEAPPARSPPPPSRRPPLVRPQRTRPMCARTRRTRPSPRSVPSSTSRGPRLRVAKGRAGAFVRRWNGTHESFPEVAWPRSASGCEFRRWCWRVARIKRWATPRAARFRRSFPQ